MRLPESLTGLPHRQRPVLRVQLALLYSGVFVGLVVTLFLASSVLFGTANVFFGHSQMAFHPGPSAAAAARHSAAGPKFTPWPFLLALVAIAVAVLAALVAGREVPAAAAGDDDCRPTDLGHQSEPSAQS
jgi:hypothetical protein